MPPLGIERLESVAQHRPPQDHPVGKLLGRDGAGGSGTAKIFSCLGISSEIRMAFHSEPVEGSSHIDILSV